MPLNRQRPRTLAGAIASAGLFAVLSLSTARAHAVDLAGTHWETVARRHGLDPLLLFAVALQESQRTRDKGFAPPWPWVTRSPEGPRFYSSREAAVADLERLMDKYRPLSIDVGLMQVNLRWHGHRLSPAELLDGRRNLEVAAGILAEALRSAPGDPVLGVGRYHQWRDEGVARRYGRRVLALLQRLRGTVI
jgi:hypothetical protein